MADGPRNHATLIWAIADLLRGDYKQSEYGRVILPLVVLRRLDCVLEPTKAAVLKRHTSLAGRIENIEPVLQAVSGQQFFNAGAVLNQGIELLAHGRPYSRGPVSVDLTFNLATNDNKIESLLPGLTSVSPGTFLLHKVGYPVGSWFAKRVVSAQLDGTGNAINVLCDDGNGGTVACGSAPAVYLGRTIPNVEGALSPSVTLWNRLRVDGLFDFKTGYKKLDGNTRVRCTIFIRCIENFRPLQGNPITVAEIQNGIPDFYINDASFLKLRQVSASYTLPDEWVQKVGASHAIVSIAGRNLLTWTRYPGLEPEAMFLGGSRGGNFSAWEQADLPQLEQWIFTVNVSY
jgi:hypothetical protein